MNFYILTYIFLQFIISSTLDKQNVKDIEHNCSNPPNDTPSSELHGDEIEVLDNIITEQHLENKRKNDSEECDDDTKKQNNSDYEQNTDDEQNDDYNNAVAMYTCSNTKELFDILFGKQDASDDEESDYDAISINISETSSECSDLSENECIFELRQLLNSYRNAASYKPCRTTGDLVTNQIPKTADIEFLLENKIPYTELRFIHKFLVKMVNLTNCARKLFRKLIPFIIKNREDVFTSTTYHKDFLDIAVLYNFSGFTKDICRDFVKLYNQTNELFKLIKKKDAKIIEVPKKVDTIISTVFIKLHKYINEMQELNYEDIDDVAEDFLSTLKTKNNELENEFIRREINE